MTIYNIFPTPESFIEKQTKKKSTCISGKRKERKKRHRYTESNSFWNLSFLTEPHSRTFCSSFAYNLEWITLKNILYFYLFINKSLWSPFLVCTTKTKTAKSIIKFWKQVWRTTDEFVRYIIFEKKTNM